MTGPWASFSASVASALGAVAAQASTPAERVARHWEDASRLTWFGAAADHQVVHVSWSFGRLRGVPLATGERHTVGVFAVTRATFRAVDEQALRAALEALVPPSADGPTRVFLQRVAAQLAVADALLALERTRELEVALFARPDAVHTPAPTSRWPEHAKDRVAAALGEMDEALRARCEETWAHPDAALLAAARRR
jgi:hypothetical protein